MSPHFVPEGKTITVVVGGPLLHRYGKKLRAAFWPHDESAPAGEEVPSRTPERMDAMTSARFTRAGAAELRAAAERVRMTVSAFLRRRVMATLHTNVVDLERARTDLKDVYIKAADALQALADHPPAASAVSVHVCPAAGAVSTVFNDPGPSASPVRGPDVPATGAAGTSVPALHPHVHTPTAKPPITGLSSMAKRADAIAHTTMTGVNHRGPAG